MMLRKSTVFAIFQSKIVPNIQEMPNTSVSASVYCIHT